MESVEHMTNALRVASQAMRNARENNRPPEVMNLLEQARQRVLRIAKKEADADIESNGVKALALISAGDYPAGIRVLRETQLQWRQRGAIAHNAVAVLQAAKTQVIGTNQIHPQMAQWTYEYIESDLSRKVQVADELAQEYLALEGEALEGARLIGESV